MQAIYTVQSVGRIFPPASLFAPSPALWQLPMPHQCYAFFSYGPLYDEQHVRSHQSINLLISIIFIVHRKVDQRAGHAENELAREIISVDGH